MPATDSRTSITEVATTMIPVSDQDAAVKFYTETLGFEKTTDVAFGEGDRWVEVSPPGAATSIALTLPRSDEWTPGRMTGIGLNSTDIDADHAALLERGVDVDPEVGRFGGPVPPMFWLRDPDGNALIVVEPTQ